MRFRASMHLPVTIYNHDMVSTSVTWASFIAGICDANQFASSCDASCEFVDFGRSHRGFVLKKIKIVKDKIYLFVLNVLVTFLVLSSKIEKLLRPFSFWSKLRSLQKQRKGNCWENTELCVSHTYDPKTLFGGLTKDGTKRQQYVEKNEITQLYKKILMVQWKWMCWIKRLF